MRIRQERSPSPQRVSHAAARAGRRARFHSTQAPAAILTSPRGGSLSRLPDSSPAVARTHSRSPAPSGHRNVDVHWGHHPRTIRAATHRLPYKAGLPLLARSGSEWQASPPEEGQATPLATMPDCLLRVIYVFVLPSPQFRKKARGGRPVSGPAWARLGNTVITRLG